MSASTGICVTGGAGYIGSHACYALGVEGRPPLVVDNLVTGHRAAVRWGPLAHIDLRDTTQLTHALWQHKTRTVLHFAASAYVGDSMQDPISYYDNNVCGMISLLQACLAAGVRHFILSSSCATYGIPQTIPITETTSQRPISPYGQSKLICENILRDAAGQAGMDFAILRYFNAAGADPSGALCEEHSPETHLIPRALAATCPQGEPLALFGTDYDTADGTCVRDYIHVSDLVRGHLMALAHLEKFGGSLVLNLGSGRGVSNMQIIQVVEEVTGAEVKVRKAPRRQGDPPSLIADINQAREILGFEPNHSDIHTIIADAARSFGLLKVQNAKSA
ncbi:UDP-glucose 4-epimerase (plasmid) [Sulfitobacter indolifex]|uniref:UDP-glucose 4-epimerase n=1 Tax=Sulfitobacter indolifex HEL-45 TaxID=391624 RepID=A0ABM9X0W0_9RHOB|nr:UDP-glucose 4-epimerase GalE [Sulfitobacter indolifex]EDQ02894.1 UDP-glucose 4-epimerase [Sulfitobacter indolifex HEL-45]UOA20641.1 UDP-glucose 4-epimerase [Sulfitobacter indolifex]UOA20790.1 UDP-glucose 4-epimerase [Sulfitobacter indolifex]